MLQITGKVSRGSRGQSVEALTLKCVIDYFMQLVNKDSQMSPSH